MLIELFGKNFGCFRDEFRLSMLPTDIEPDSERGILEVNVEEDDEPLRLLRCAAIYGPNASGKSTILRAASVLRDLVSYSAHFASDDPLEAYEPFLLNPAFSNQPVLLGLRAVISGQVYDYSVEFDSAHILREQLEKLAPTRSDILFHRAEDRVSGSWEQHAQFSLLKESFRPNALLLSLADLFVPRVAKGIAVGLRRALSYRDPAQSVSLEGLLDKVATLVKQQPAFHDWLVSWLRAADLGVLGIQIEEEIKKRLVREIQRQPGRREKVVHRLEPTVKLRLALLHSSVNEPTKFDFARESMGTRRFIEIAPIVHALAHGEVGRTYFVDEIGASLHPALLQALVQYINCDLPKCEVRGQLIFATHETFIVDDEARHAALRRDQVYFTDKDATGASRLYSLAEFKERQVHNLRRRYLQGRYGAIPSIGPIGG